MSVVATRVVGEQASTSSLLQMSSVSCVACENSGNGGSYIPKIAALLTWHRLSLADIILPTLILAPISDNTDRVPCLSV